VCLTSRNSGARIDTKPVGRDVFYVACVLSNTQFVTIYLIVWSWALLDSHQFCSHLVVSDTQFVTIYLTVWSWALLDSHRFCSHSIVSDHFMEPEDSLLHSPWTRSIQSAPQHPITTRCILTLSAHLRLDIPSVNNLLLRSFIKESIQVRASFEHFVTISFLYTVKSFFLTFGCCILLRIYPTGSLWCRQSQQNFNTLTRFYLVVCSEWERK
jgi:hypothetical protein